MPAKSLYFLPVVLKWTPLCRLVRLTLQFRAAKGIPDNDPNGKTHSRKVVTWGRVIPAAFQTQGWILAAGASEQNISAATRPVRSHRC